MPDVQAQFAHPYAFDPKYKKKVAYFSMEFAIHQPLKIYSGGLGFLAGSHMRSAYDLQQNVVGIGMLWKYGYYDQVRKGDKSMDSLFQEKLYSFLEPTHLKFEVEINGNPVHVTAFYLPPETFGSVPMFLLSTDIPENDYLAQTITHKLYDAEPAARIAQEVILGVGGAKLLELIGHTPEIYHFNEAHALPAAFYLYSKHNSVEEVRKRLVFTTHTPEEAGNPKQDIHLLQKMGFFAGLSLDTVREISGENGEQLNYTLTALRLAKAANAVSKLHLETSRKMWDKYDNICPLIYITNAQNMKYWADRRMYLALEAEGLAAMMERKKFLKNQLFETVADQTGKLFDPDVLTIVWARRFAGYKRPDLITQQQQRFLELVNRADKPVQIIWAGKPYPMDYGAISIFNNLVQMTRPLKRAAVLVGYELSLSRLLKRGADVWLNTPRVPREASGTSGMTAAANGAVNFSTNDGWIVEYSKPGINSFVVPEADRTRPTHEQDQFDMLNFLNMLENEIIPLYYDHPEQWQEIMKASMQDVVPYFDADRMAYQYYDKLYNFELM